MSITPLKYTQSLAEGLTTEDILTLAADLRLRLSHIDPLCRWCRQWRPINIDETVMPLSFFSFSVSDFLRFAGAL